MLVSYLLACGAAWPPLSSRRSATPQWWAVASGLVALAVFKDLCLDAVDPARLARFWASVLGRPVEEAGEGARLPGDSPQHTIWVNAVPEPKSVKNRVHLDVYAAALSDLEQLGARVVDTTSGKGRWTVMADPEGGEFCAFLRDPLPEERLHGLVVDSADPAAQAEWWGHVYGAEVVHHAAGWSTVQAIAGMPIATMDFVPVPEAKTVKNRVHWDVMVTELGPLVDAGATVVRPRGEDRQWDVLADPEGNEFCAFTVADG